MRALDRDRLQLILCDFEVTATADVITFYDVLIVHRFTRDRVNLDELDPISRLPVDLVKSVFFAIGSRGE
jgi:hypothetical protein